MAPHVQTGKRTAVEELTQRSLTRRQDENCDTQRNPSATFVPALGHTVAPEKEKLNGLLKVLTMPFVSRAKNTTNAEVRASGRAEKTLIDPGPSTMVLPRSRENTGTATQTKIKMVKLFDLVSAGPCSDALMERDLTEYGLTWDALGGEDGKKQWGMFKKQIRAAVSLSSPHSYFTSSSKSEHNSIILIFDKFNAYLQLCEIKGQVALCEEFGRHWAGFAIYYFANSGTWPEPYEEFQCLHDDRDVTRENEGMKTKRTQRYQSIPDGLQRLDISVFVPLTKSTATGSGASSGRNHVGKEVDSACDKNEILLNNAATSQAQPFGMVETRKISLFSEHPANTSK
ncbi:hypothetical protein GALMADRAFT_208859 [Galerina marginata CBS 339.88]|uniref:Uncharacterized protein n=1 Tax=Galerina marginata (strain CBS 339.88) TaxID=685588 RepID=A0A067TB05_GALM3|nr:hypothetical protein GALMADRAFT_208859 [Galerina marginata CBS 339.88]